MKNLLLLPRSFRIIGLILLPLFITLLIATLYDFQFSWLNVPFTPENPGTSDHNLTNELAMAGTAISLFFIGFSKLRQEDEYLRTQRLQALHISIYAYLIVLMFMIFAFNGFLFLVMMAWNAASVLVLFNLFFFGKVYLTLVFTQKRAAV